ncbi:MAG: lamin tail domain-containing protein, partial [Planctomycetota bacterium]
YGGNSDWPFKNYYSARERGDDSTGFKFHMWDAEWSLGLRSSLSTNKVNDFRGVAEPYGNLRPSLEFQTRFGDRAHRALFNDGPLTTDNAIDRYLSILSEVDSAIDSEAGRWGDQHFSSGYDRNNWLNETSNVVNNFLQLRTDRFVDQLRGANLYPAIDAVAWNQRGGNVTPAFDIELSATQGTIYYTLDGTDPREIGGAVSANAIEYTSPINLQSDATITGRVLHNGQWSAIDSASFDSTGTSLEEEFLQVVEIHYHPTDATDLEISQGFGSATQFEFVELLNTSSTETLDLQGIAFTNGIDATFTQPTPLPPQSRALVVSDLAAFTQRYGQPVVDSVAAVIQSTSGQLSNGGETLTLSGPNGEEIFSVEYDDDAPWTPVADGVGSLQLVDETNTPSEAVNKYYSWRNSYQPNGTPGEAPVVGVPAIVINEVLTNGEAPVLDAIELYNSGTESVDIGGWFLSDNSNDFAKYEIPADTMIEPGEVVMFDERDFNNPSNPTAFGLSSLGEEVWLTQPAGQTVTIVDSVEFGASFGAQSLGLYPDGSGRMSPKLPTIGSPNEAPLVWSVGMSEFNFHPADPTASDLTIDPALVDDDLEFVEIHNASATPVDLTGWTLSGEIDYAFPSMMLPGRESVVVVSFPPENASRLSAFQNHYGVATSNVLGPFDGHLSNNFGLLSLNRPGQPVEGETPVVAVDELVYDDTSPWPAGVDGEGASLHRLSSTFPTESSSSWIAITPSPGITSFFVNPPPQVASVQRDDGQLVRPDQFERLRVAFDSSVSLSSSALTVTSATGNSIDISAASFSYDDATFVATWDLNTTLPPGVYEFALIASEVVTSSDNTALDGDGNGQAGGDYATSFYVAIPGDANLDMTVDVSDFNKW